MASMSSWYTPRLAERAPASCELSQELQQLRAHKKPIPRLCGSQFAHGSVMASIAMADMAHSLLKQVRAASDLPETVSAVVVAAMQLLVHHSQVPAPAAPAPGVLPQGVDRRSDNCRRRGAGRPAGVRPPPLRRDRGAERGASSHLRRRPRVEPPPLRGDRGTGGRRSTDLIDVLCCFCKSKNLARIQ